MSRLNSSIFNSSVARLYGVWSSTQVVVWALIGLVAIDIAINVIFAYPSDPKVTEFVLGAAVF